MSSFILLFLCGFLGSTLAGEDVDMSLDYSVGPSCRTWGKRDRSAPSCAKLADHAIVVADVVYGPPGIQYVVMASDYYMARLALALNSHGGPHNKSLCPGDETKWNDMQLTAMWTGQDSAQNWDLGFQTRATRRPCTFPDETFPFLCQGLPGTHGTHGETLGWLSYIPVLTDNKTWALFVNCWDPDRPGHTGTNYARSWVAFNKRKTFTREERTSIIHKITRLGFDPKQVFHTHFINPTQNPIPPYITQAHHSDHS